MARNRRSRFSKGNTVLKTIFLRIQLKAIIRVFLLILLCLLPAIPLFYLGKAIYNSPVFKIKEVRSNVELERGLVRHIKTMSIFNVDIKDVRSRVLENNPYYKEVFVFKEFPSKLLVAAKIREPFAQIKGREFFSVDREGVVLAGGSSEPFPHLVPIEITGHKLSYRKGERITGEPVKYAFNLIDELKKIDFTDNFSVKVINATKLETLFFILENMDSSAEKVTANEVKVIVGEGDFSRKLHIFENILEKKLKGDLLTVKYIDLRYKKVYMQPRW